MTAEVLPFVRGLPLRMRIFFDIAFLSELIRQCCGLGNTVGLVDIADGEHTRYKDFAHDRPLVQGSGALKGDTDAFENGGILFLTTADQCALFAKELILLAANHEAEHLIDHSLDLGRNRIPVNRAGEHEGIRSEDIVSNGVEIIIKGTGLAGLVAGLAGVAEVQLQLGGIDDLHFISLCRCSLSECLSHPVAVTAFPGASGKNKDLFRHGIVPPVVIIFKN